ncbi:hypothetical protein SAMN05444320_1321, partial [Streptoalloteichus hindustanus]
MRLGVVVVAAGWAVAVGVEVVADLGGCGGASVGDLVDQGFAGGAFGPEAFGGAGVVVGRG